MCFPYEGLARLLVHGTTSVLAVPRVDVRAHRCWLFKLRPNDQVPRQDPIATFEP